MVPVGDERLARAEPGVDARELLGVADGPQPLALVVTVDEVVERLGGGDLVDDGAHLGRGAVDQQDRSRVELQLAHPVGQLVGLHGVDPLVREDGPVLGAAGAVRDVERTDEATDREPARGVLVQVERGLGVAHELAALLPLREPGGDRAVRAGEEASRGGVPDAARLQAQTVEGGEAQRSTHVRWDDHGAGVHPPMLGRRR